MPLGEGFWYNRRTNRFIRIDDHARDACANPEKFGLTDKDLIKVVSAGCRTWTSLQGHVLVMGEEDRDLIIPRVCQAGYIRVRHWNGKLAWQFAGDPLLALQTLHRRAERLGLGPATLVTFTDFGLGLSVTDLYARFRPNGNRALQNLLDTWIARYERSKPPAN